MEKEGGEAILVGWIGLLDILSGSEHQISLLVSEDRLTVDFGAWGQRWVLRERIGDVLIGSIGVLVGLPGVIVVLQRRRSAELGQRGWRKVFTRIKTL